MKNIAHGVKSYANLYRRFAKRTNDKNRVRDAIQSVGLIKIAIAASIAASTEF
jgi:hypothetical protein